MSEPLKFLALEGVLKTRLQAKVPAAVKVFSASDLLTVKSHAQVAPAIHVYYGGFTVLEEKDNGSTQMIEQRWFAVPVVRNAANQVTGEGARVAASELIEIVMEALLGFRPGAPYSALRLYDGPMPAWIDNLGYHPLGFKTTRVCRGELTKL